MVTSSCCTSGRLPLIIKPRGLLWLVLPMVTLTFNKRCSASQLASYFTRCKDDTTTVGGSDWNALSFDDFKGTMMKAFKL